MYWLSGSDQPWLRRIDHLICEVPDIEEAMRLFIEELGFPVAWPIGRFWPQGRTSGVALGGFNLEFIQLDKGPPEEAWISTVVFEPVSLDAAIDRYQMLGLPTDLREKWESDPHLLRLRSFDELESKQSQLICRNLVPTIDTPLDFFLCDYSPRLRQRLSPSSFPAIPPVTAVIAAFPEPAQAWSELNRLFGLPRRGRGCELLIKEKPAQRAEVVAIRSDRGPLDLRGWPARFQFV